LYQVNELANKLPINAYVPAVIPAQAGILICYKSTLREKDCMENQQR
jgi:hypothetical protein